VISLPYFIKAIGHDTGTDSKKSDACRASARNPPCVTNCGETTRWRTILNYGHILYGLLKTKINKRTGLGWEIDLQKEQLKHGFVFVPL
jgi:hypothetical protein